MLDKLSPEMRHLVLMLLVPVLGFLSTVAVPSLVSDPVLAGFIGVVLTGLLAYFTPLTKQYGVGTDSGEGDL